MSEKEYIYYPGCAVRSTAKHYEESLLRIFEELGLKLTELEDWNCCGATLCAGVSKISSFALTSRNLALAERDHAGLDIVTPCSACYLAFIKTKDYMERYPELRKKVETALAAIDLRCQGKARVRHPLEVIVTDVGLDEIRRRVKKRLTGFRVAPYYGCQTTRPYGQFDHPFFPDSMDRLLKELGAEVVDYPLKTKCCGGVITSMVEEVGLRLNYILVHEAHKRGANAISTACPLCQFNLDVYQKKMIKEYDLDFSVPILYFTQLLGLALGIREQELGFGRVMVPVKHLLATVR